MFWEICGGGGDNFSLSKSSKNIKDGKFMHKRGVLCEFVGHWDAFNIRYLFSCLLYFVQVLNYDFASSKPVKDKGFLRCTRERVCIT